MHIITLADGEGTSVLTWIVLAVVAILIGYGYLLMRLRPTRGFQAKLYRLLKKVIARITNRVDLSDEKVNSFQIEIAGEPRIYPGGSISLVAVCVLDGGKVERSKGVGQGRVPWKDLPVTVDGATAEEGIVTLHDDPRVAPKAIAVKVGLAGHPDLAGEVNVPVHFAGHYVAHFGGRAGRNGVNGDPGSPGWSGGTDGGRGRDGCDGENGDDGGEVEVTVAAVEGPMLQVRVQGAPYEDKFFLVDPNGGSLILYARGGNGGKGGDGGWGGGGGTGGGNGGDGGDGGNGANGGDGGRISLTTSPEAKPHLDIVKLDNLGGDGGNVGQGGPGGAGGSTDSQGQTPGRSGNHGRPGQRAGRPGREGPKPEIKLGPVGKLW